MFKHYIPSEFLLEASEISLATLSSLRLPGIRDPSSRPCSEADAPKRLRVSGE
jgi:hypothetical protein